MLQQGAHITAQTFTIEQLFRHGSFVLKQLLQFGVVAVAEFEQGEQVILLLEIVAGAAVFKPDPAARGKVQVHRRNDIPKDALLHRCNPTRVIDTQHKKRRNKRQKIAVWHAGLNRARAERPGPCPVWKIHPLEHGCPV